MRHRPFQIVSNDDSLAIRHLDWLAADETLREEVDVAAHINLANVGADRREVVHAGRDGGWD